MTTTTSAPEPQPRGGPALAPLRARWAALGARDKRVVTTLGWVLGVYMALMFLRTVAGWRGSSSASGVPSRQAGSGSCWRAE